jgi:1-acyl-sn-glycerol-3-phosphate acyltransferase
MKSEDSGSRLGSFGLVIYNLIYWPYLLASCVLLFLPALVLYAFTFWDPRRRILHAYTSVWGAHYLAWAPFAGVRLEGREQALSGGPCVYVSNHQSMVDILAAFATRLPYLWVSKVENFFVPFLGWNMWLSGYIPLRRGNIASIRRMLRSCEARIRSGASLFVFPEGTRSPDGELQTFYRGAFWVAARYRVPIVPVVIDGTARVLPKRSFRIVPQRVTVRILPPVNPSDFDWNDRRLRDHVHGVMERTLADMKENA